MVVAAAVVLAGCLAPEGSRPDPPQGKEPPGFDTLSVRFEPLLSGLQSPVLATHAGDGSGRLFVVEQEGRILVAREGALLSQPFLDLRDVVLAGGERGLLGLGFAPDFEATGRFYVDYTAREGDGDTVIARYRAAAGSDRAEAAGETLLVVEQPYANHNGGALAFGPDGFLYVGMGDGGSGGDPHGYAQSLATHLGKLLRLDVSKDAGYAVPAGNPFVDEAGAKPEIWAFGLRNPWRISFDRETGDLWIGDVGQNRAEEVDFAPRSSRGGENYGWNLWEGAARFRPGDARGTPILPVAEYVHEAGRCSVTGGHVVRDATQPALSGVYVYADYCTGEVWGLVPSGDSWRGRLLGDLEGQISSFGEDESGRVLVVDHGGAVLRLVASP